VEHHSLAVSLRATAVLHISPLLSVRDAITSGAGTIFKLGEQEQTKTDKAD